MQNDMRKAFEEAITANKYDVTTRMAFADWLNENGFDDEAEKARKWTVEKQKAEDWLREQAAQHQTCDGYGHWVNDSYDDSQENWREVTYEEFIRAGIDSINGDEDWWNGFTQMGSESLRDDFFSNEENRKKYWECIALVEDIHPTEEQIKNLRPFSCSC